MSVKDALLFNTTGSNFQALQTDDTARIKGDLSLQKDDGTEVVGIDVSQGSVNVVGNITASVNISGSVGSTGSFGRVVATTFHGDGSALKATLPRSVGILTSSAQIAAQISGAFTAGFEFSSSISGSATSTGSFGRVEGIEFFGDGSNIKTTIPRSTGLLTSSAQIASDISGSFNKGFNFTGTIQATPGGTFSLGASIGRRTRYTSGLGSVNAAMVMGGNNVHTPTTLTEEYDGSSWSEGGELPEASSLGGASGTVNAGLYFGGFGGSESGDGTYTYNGTNWSETTDLPGNSTTGTVGAGSNQGAALAMIGTSDNQLNDAYEWNGSNWSEISEIGTNRGRNQGGGESTEAAIVVGGDDTPACIKTNQTEIWNGTNWTEVNDTIHPVRYNSFAGTTNDGIVMGALTTPYSQASQLWDGTTWSETATLIFDAFAPAASGRVGVGALAGGAHKFGGGTFSTPDSEIFAANVISGSFGRLEFTKISGDGTNLKSTLPYSPGLLTSSAQIASNISGSFNKGFAFGQSGSLIFTGVSGSTYHFSGSVSASYFGSDYNRHLADQIGHIRSEGSSGSRSPFQRVGGVVDGTWTQLAGGSLNTKRSTAQNSMTGETNAAIIAGSGPNEYDNCTCTEIWNGTSWSEVNDYITGRRGTTQIGSVYASVLVGGCQTWTSKKLTEEWNGHSWAAGTDLPDSSGSIIGFGTQNDAVFMSGQGQGQGSKFYNYNGTNFSTPGVAQEELVLKPGAPSNGTTGQSADGTSNDGIIHYTGGVPATGMFGCAQVNGSTRFWDGLAISRGPDTNTAPTGFYGRGLWGKSNSAILTRGNNTSNTEIFNGISWSEVTNFPAGPGGSNYGHAGTSADSGIKLHTVSGESNLYEWVGQYNTTASFGRLDGGVLRGDATGITGSIPYNGVVSSSAQIASNISGSFNKGFNFTGTIKAEEASWAAGGCLIQERWALGGVGSVNAAIAVGGQCGPHTHHNTPYALTEQYDGTSFTEVNDMINASTGTAAGLVDNAYFHKLYSGNDTENWNGTNWSAGHVNPTTANQYIGGSTPSELYVIGAISNCGNFFSDYNVTGGTFAVCTAVPFTFGYGAGNFGHSGDMTAGIVSSGWTNPVNPQIVQETVIWNGSTWSDASSQLIPYPARAGWSGHKQGGTVNASFMVGGQSAPPSGPSYQGYDSTHVVNAFQNWDGTSWSVKAEIPQVHYDHAAVGTPQAALFFGGIAQTPVAPTYRHIRSGSFNYEDDLTTGSFGRLEFISASGDASVLQSSITYVTNPSFNILTGSSQIASQISGSFTSGFNYSGLMGKARGGVFASSTNMLDIHTGGNGGSMLQGTAIVAGGSYGGGWPPSTTDNTQIYDGTSWTEVNNLTSGVRSNDTLGLAGDSSAALFFGGPVGPGATEEWNGTNWTEVADIPDHANSGAGAGGESSESAIWVNYFAGRGNKWDGTSWSEINNLNFPRYDGNSTGTRDEHFVVGGSSPVGAPTYPYNLCSEVFNGTNWSAVADVITPLIQAFGMGAYNDAIFAGGWDAPSGHLACNHTQTFDGTSWASGPNIVNRRRAESAGSKYSGPAAGGATNAAYIAGGSPGYPTYNSNKTEVFPGFVVSASFGRLEAGRLLGDASGLTDSLPYPAGIVSRSAQLASNISGSFNQGFEYTGNISGSANSSGSFGLVKADFIFGDGSSISGSLERSVGVVSGSAQIASNISGSFNKGFGYDGTIKTKPAGWVTTWYTGHDLNTGRSGLGGKGGPDAAIAVAGVRNFDAPVAGTISAFYTGTAGVKVGCTEEWNGISWTEVNDATDAGATGYGGTTEAGYAMGKFHPLSNNTEEWNGTNWSEGPAIDAGSAGRRSDAGGCAPNTMYIIGGYTPGGVPYFTTFNGTNFTAEPNMPSVRQNVRNFHAGNSPSAIAAGGAGGGCCTNVWNGSSWSEVGALPFKAEGNTGAGTVNDAYSYGGRRSNAPTYPNAVEGCTDTFIAWDGTSWSEITAGTPIPTYSPYAGVRSAIGTGTGASEVFVFGGKNMRSPSVYEWAATSASLQFESHISSGSFHNIEATTLTGDGSSLSASLQSQLLTSVTQISNSISGSFNKGFDLQGGVSASFGLQGGGTWRSGGTLNNSGYWGVAVGHENAALQIGGNGRTQKTEEYNGVVWTEVTDTINSHGTGGDLGATGTTEGSVLVTSAGVEIWNGSNWSEAVATYPVASAGIGSGGVSQNAGLFFKSANNDEWNGISFTEKANINNGRSYFASSGQSTEAAIIAGGNTSTANATPGIYTETWDGTSWTEVADLISGRQMGEGAGHTNYFLMIGGSHSNSNLTDGNVEIFNGTSWSVTSNLITHVRVNSATGGNSDILGGCGALTIGGASPGGGSTKTEHFVTDTSGSFGQLGGTVGGEIETDMFMVSGSTMKLPMFSDADLNYISQEPQESTGSMSGSVVRAGDVNILNKPGNFSFHTDNNALAFTYVSSSVYSQSIDFVTCGYQSASVYTSSTGLISQSHYCYHNVVQYITGSYT